MTEQTASTRRAFLKGGAILAAPLAGAAATAAHAGDPAADRLARLEDMAAIRARQRDFVRAVNAGDRDAAAAFFAKPDTATLDPTVRALDAGAAHDADALDLADDRGRATARLYCTARTETAVDCAGTVAQMARLQGDGVIRAAEAAVLETEWVKQDGAWKIARADLRPA